MRLKEITSVTCMSALLSEATLKVLMGVVPSHMEDMHVCVE